MLMHEGLVDNSEHFENKLTDNWLREDKSWAVLTLRKFKVFQDVKLKLLLAQEDFKGSLCHRQNSTNMHYDWSVKGAIIEWPVRLKGNIK